MGDRSPPAPVGGFQGTRRFRRVMRRGAGGMGVVYEVIDGDRGLCLALKTLPYVRPRAILRLKQEFRTLRDLSHPNLVQLHELIFEEGLWFFTMELVEGKDFLTYVRPWSEEARARVLDEGRLRACVVQLASALRYLHGEGVVHCDVKPSNVLVTPEGRVVVLDFGLAVGEGDEGAGDELITGTPAYMAPEQIAGGRVSAATDGYSLGILLHEALTGARPFEDPDGGPAADPAPVGDSNSTRTLPRRRVPPRGPPPPLDAAGLPVDLVALRTRLLALSPEDRPDDADVLEALGVAAEDKWSGAFAAPPGAEDGFVGRATEQHQIRRAFADARRGAFVAVAVQGVSGIGKTALVQKAVRAVERADGALVLRGRCHERESLPFKAFDGIVDDLVRTLARDGVARREVLQGPGVEALTQLFPTVGALGVPLPAGGAAGERWKDARALAFGALKDLLASVATERPLVLVVEDVHWADGDSVALLSELGRPPSPPLLVLVTARPGQGGPCLAVASLGEGARRIDLGGLAREELLALVGSHGTGTAGAADPRGPREGGGAGGVDIDALLQETEGHPMFVEELLRSATRQRPRAEGSRVVALDDALWARASTLGEHARRALEAIAAAGQPTALIAVREGAGLRADHFAEGLRELERQKLARSSGTGDKATVEPYHDRVREAVYARLDGDTRRAVHGRLAWGLGLVSAPPEMLVHHFQLGGNASLAGRYAKEAALRMEAVFAYDRAAAFWAIALASAPQRGPTRTGLLLCHGRALGRAGRPKEAADAFLQAATMDGVTDEQRFDLERQATGQLLSAGYMTEGLALARTLLSKVGLALPEGRLGVLASLLWHQWRSRQVPVDLPRAPELSKEQESAEGKRLDVLWTVGSGLLMVDAARGTALNAAALKGALLRGDSFRRARALCAATVADASSGDPERARALAEAARAAAARDGGNVVRVYALLAQVAVTFLVDNRVAECVPLLREAEALWQEAGLGAGWETAILAQYMCWSLWWAGDLVGLRERWEASVRGARLGGHLYLETALRVAFPCVHMMDDRPDDARTDGARALAHWSAGGREDGLLRYWALEGRTYLWFYEGAAAKPDDLWADWAAFDRSIVSRVRVLRVVSHWLRYKMAINEAFRAHADPSAEARARTLREVQAWARRYWKADPTGRETDSGPGKEAVLHLLAGDRKAAVAPLRAVIEVERSRKAMLLATSWRVLLGEVMGGAEGDAVRSEALGFFASQGVRRPEAFAYALVPMRPL